jgi:hypothetical protein
MLEAIRKLIYSRFYLHDGIDFTIGELKRAVNKNGPVKAKVSNGKETEIYLPVCFQVQVNQKKPQKAKHGHKHRKCWKTLWIPSCRWFKSNNETNNEALSFFIDAPSTDAPVPIKWVQLQYHYHSCSPTFPSKGIHGSKKVLSR